MYVCYQRVMMREQLLRSIRVCYYRHGQLQIVYQYHYANKINESPAVTLPLCSLKRVVGIGICHLREDQVGYPMYQQTCINITYS